MIRLDKIANLIIISFDHYMWKKATSMMFREEEELEKPDLEWKEVEKENQRKKTKTKEAGKL